MNPTVQPGLLLATQKYTHIYIRLQDRPEALIVRYPRIPVCRHWSDLYNLNNQYRRAQVLLEAVHPRSILWKKTPTQNRTQE